MNAILRPTSTADKPALKTAGTVKLIPYTFGEIAILSPTQIEVREPFFTSRKYYVPSSDDLDSLLAFLNDETADDLYEDKLNDVIEGIVAADEKLNEQEGE